MTDEELLCAYARSGAHDPFAQLVGRHLDFTYACAFRQTRSASLADDVTQSVFLHLALHASRLRPDTHLKSWLCVATRHKAIDAIRSESRRRQRENTASSLIAMNMPHSPLPSSLALNASSEISATLDDVLNALPDSDRAAILLRFFEGKSLHEIGRHLNLSEDAAQKRVARALEKLRTSFERRGIRTTAALLAVQLPVHAALSAPAALATTLTNPAFLSSASSSAAATFAQTLIMTTAKTAVLSAALVAALSVVFFEALTISDIKEQASRAEQRASSLREESNALRQTLALSQPPPSLLSDSESASDPLRETLRDVVSRASFLQRLFEEIPEENIPELQLLSEADWLGVAAQYDLQSTVNIDSALSQVRNRARVKFTTLLRGALGKYILASGDTLPDTTLALLPYFDPPIDAAVLARYEMTRTGTATDAGPRNIILREKKSATDNSLDALVEFAMMRTHFAIANNRRPSRVTSVMLSELNVPPDRMRPVSPETSP